MHAVVVNANVHDVDRATQRLHDEVVPRVSQAPGFVAAYWIRTPGPRGLSIIVFDSEENARATASRLQADGSGTDAVTLEGVDVHEVVANA